MSIKFLKNKPHYYRTINIAAFIICCSAFILGCIIGTFLSGKLPDNTGLSQFFASYLGTYGNTVENTYNFGSVFFNIFKYYLLLFVFGFSAFGAVLIPSFSLVKGMTLAFAISSAVRLYGLNGVLYYFSIFGIGQLITIPCFLIVGSYAFDYSISVLRFVFSGGIKDAAAPDMRSYLIKCTVCILLMICVSFVDAYFILGTCSIALLSI